jgi:hypothetical protein
LHKKSLFFLKINQPLKHNNFIHQAALLVLLGVSTCFLNSCQKPEFGNELRPDLDGLNALVSDSITLLTTTVLQDSVLSDETQFNLCGELHDPIFGESNAQFAAQARLLLNNVNYPEGTEIDSMVLVLPYAGAYGDIKKLNGLQKFTVFEVDENLSLDSAYYSTKQVNVKSEPIGQTNYITPRIRDSVTVKGKKEAPQLRIKLNNSLAARFIDPANAASMQNSDNFTQFFKGLVVRAQSRYQTANQGAIVYFDLIRGGKMVMYYNDSLETNFVFNEASARINMFSHNFNAAQFALDTLPKPNEWMYIQSNAGAITKIRFPYLNQMAQFSQKILVHKAELNVEVDYPNFSVYTPVPTMQILKRDSLNEFAFLNANAADGTRASYNPANKSYTFDLTAHIQEILVGRRKNFDLFILPLGGANQSARVKLFGPNSTQRPLKLKFIYQLID